MNLRTSGFWSVRVLFKWIRILESNIIFSIFTNTHSSRCAECWLFRKRYWYVFFFCYGLEVFKRFFFVYRPVIIMWEEIKIIWIPVVKEKKQFTKHHVDDCCCAYEPTRVLMKKKKKIIINVPMNPCFYRYTFEHGFTRRSLDSGWNCQRPYTKRMLLRPCCTHRISRVAVGTLLLSFFTITAVHAQAGGGYTSVVYVW